jgi:hypothetical protein
MSGTYPQFDRGGVLLEHERMAHSALAGHHVAGKVIVCQLRRMLRLPSATIYMTARLRISVVGPLRPEDPVENLRPDVPLWHRDADLHDAQWLKSKPIASSCQMP